jgi:hypothetical protein
MKKSLKTLRSKFFIFFLIQILVACSNNESQTKPLNTENIWIEKLINKGAANNLSHTTIELEHQGESVQATLSCENKSVHLKFVLINAQFTTTVVYVAEDTKWVKGSYLALRKGNITERPKHLAIQRPREDNIYDLNLPISMLIAEGKPQSIEAQLANGKKLVISFNKLASSFIDGCIKK